MRFKPTRTYLGIGLGVLGLVPFVGSAIAYLFGPANLAGTALLTLMVYAGLIASFLGGARWGVELIRSQARPGILVISVLPSLAAWGLIVGTATLSPAWQLGGLILVLAIEGAWDVASPELPLWYLRMRLPLTVIACSMLGVVLAKILLG